MQIADCVLQSQNPKSLTIGNTPYASFSLMIPLYSLQEWLSRGLAIVLILSLKGLVQAWVAARLGDEGPKQDGRLTPNPAQHISFVGLVSFLGFSLGWTKPMGLDPTRLGARGFVGVALAGILTCGALAWLAALLRPLVVNAFTSGDMGFVLSAFLNTLVDLSLWCAVLGLIPLFPLDGFTALGGFIPRWWKWARTYVLYFEIGLLVLAISKIPTALLGPLQSWLRQALAGF